MSQESESSIKSSSTSGTQNADVETLEELKERLAYWKAIMEAEKNEAKKAILTSFVKRLTEQVAEEEREVGGRRRRTSRRHRGGRGKRVLLKKLTKRRKHRK